jgi:hypothetical protein
MTLRRTAALALGASVIALALAGDATTSPARATTNAAPPSTAAKERARRLEDVYIEGEIPVPQVLFVTGRDQRRYFDFQHQRYLQQSLEANRKAAAPTWVRVVGNRPISGRKDAAR